MMKPQRPVECRPPLHQRRQDVVGLEPQARLFRQVRSSTEGVVPPPSGTTVADDLMTFVLIHVEEHRGLRVRLLRCGDASGELMTCERDAEKRHSPSRQGREPHQQHVEPSLGIFRLLRLRPAG